MRNISSRLESFVCVTAGSLVQDPNPRGIRRVYGPTVLPPREKPSTPDRPVAVVMETGYSTAFWGKGSGFILFGADRTGGSIISLFASVENEFLA
ncbi:hypothetical protein AVEN_109178-1 [Araneus ventricosus]|uniref:Uncharacterized protein n=1 Tax=Araneus ventricosus TaxID=182803 RepID=A0A4Y2L418_ARAVE|nr:hypothetical protein AVEN_109178-1 [Araneus ventricosus]